MCIFELYMQWNILSAMNSMSIWHSSSQERNWVSLIFYWVRQDGHPARMLLLEFLSHWSHHPLHRVKHISLWRKLKVGISFGCSGLGTLLLEIKGVFSFTFIWYTKMMHNNYRKKMRNYKNLTSPLLWWPVMDTNKSNWSTRSFACYFHLQSNLKS